MICSNKFSGSNFEQKRLRQKGKSLTSCQLLHQDFESEQTSILSISRIHSCRLRTWTIRVQFIDPSPSVALYFISPKYNYLQIKSYSALKGRYLFKYSCIHTFILHYSRVSSSLLKCRELKKQFSLRKRVCYSKTWSQNLLGEYSQSFALYIQNSLHNCCFVFVENLKSLWK